jgi:hypothetical protein
MIMSIIIMDVIILPFGDRRRVFRQPGHPYTVNFGDGRGLESGRESLLSLQGTDILGEELLNVADILLEQVVNPVVVDIPIDVDQPVPEPGHRLQAFSKVFVEEPVFLHDTKRVGIIFRYFPSILRDHMVGEIDSRLDADDQVILRACTEVRIPCKYLPR